MDIYSIGEEKCIDGVWGREVNGRFYDWVSQGDGKGLYRRLDIDNSSYQHYAVYGTNVNPNEETLYIQNREQLKAYTPKHIKDLENLKRGDIVWLKIGTSFGEKWMSTRFVKKIQDYYITSNVFDGEGGVDEQRTATYKIVYLKPPFDI